jgi:hypothetical protein
LPPEIGAFHQFRRLALRLGAAGHPPALADRAISAIYVA